MSNKINKVFLGGTCNGSKWRDIIINNINKDYFNPVVKDWTPACQEEERRQKEKECDCELYVITPKIKGVFSIAEVVDASNKRPDETLFCFIDTEDDFSFDEGDIRSLNAVKDLVKSNGAHVFNSLEDVIEFINK